MRYFHTEARQMETFDQLIQDIDSRYSLGSNACRLVQETFALITGLPGGIDGLLDRLKAAGFAVEVATWSKGSDPMPLTGHEAERMLGLDAIEEIAKKVNLSQSFAKTILGYAIPKIILLAREGAVPPANPAAASACGASSDSSVRAEELPQPAKEQAEPCGREDFGANGKMAEDIRALKASAASETVPISKRLTGRGFKAARAVCMLAFAFAAGWYSSSGWSPLNPFEVLRQAQSQSQKEVTLEGLSTRLNVVKTETTAAITGIAGKLDQTRRESE